MNKIFYLFVLVCLTACTAQPQTPMATPTQVPVPSLFVEPSPTPVPLPDGEIIYSDKGKWYAVGSDGLVQPLSWINNLQDDGWYTVWFRPMVDTQYLSVIMRKDAYEVHDYFRLAVINRADYANPVGITDLDSITQRYPTMTSDPGLYGNDLVPLWDFSTNHLVLTLWKIHQDGTVTKEWDFGPLRTGADSPECEGFTWTDAAIPSPGGELILRTWEHGGSNCISDPKEQNFGPPDITMYWEVINSDGLVISSWSNSYNESKHYGNMSFPIGWANDNTIIATWWSFAGDETSVDNNTECFRSIDIRTGEFRDFYCETDFPRLDRYEISPNGKYLAFIKDYEKILIIKIEDGAVTASTDPARNGYPFLYRPIWSYDSMWATWIIDTGDDNNHTVFALRADGQANEILFNPGSEVKIFPDFWLAKPDPSQ